MSMLRKSLALLKATSSWCSIIMLSEPMRMKNIGP